MSVLGWMSAIGALLLFMALTSAQVQRLPVSTSFIYLLVGVTLGPAGVGLLRIDLAEERRWFEVLTQTALIVSLFVGGLRLRLPLNHSAWVPALRLAGPVMIASIAGAALFGHLVLGFAPLLALLIGATLAPTDPVLASAVAVNDAEDHDRVRFALSGEAGLNDGMAFPFVFLALEGMERAGEPGLWIGTWAASRLLWAVPAGLFVGYLLGVTVGRFAIRLRSQQGETGAPSDFLALALIALAYVAAERLHAWGFLAAFAAGVGLRHAELRVVRESPARAVNRRVTAMFARRRARSSVMPPPAETLVSPSLDADTMREPALAAGVLISETLTFGDTMERMLEVLLVVLVGIMLVDVWTWSGVALAAVLFLVVRPAATRLLLHRTHTTGAQRNLLGWFGLRGIGSLYYLSYALSHGVGGADGRTLIGVVITVVACSIVVHGISVTPVLRYYERRLQGNRQ